MDEKVVIHFLPGDAVVESFAATGLSGEVLVCRECLAGGPKNASGDQFWNLRAGFIAGQFGEDEESYHRKVTDEFRRLREAAVAGAEINLWFEYELFCQANYWFTLDFLRGATGELFRVAPVHQDLERIWLGFSNHDGKDLENAFANRVVISPKDVDFGSRLWKAYSRGERAVLADLAGSHSSAFPFLDQVISAAIREDELPRRVLVEIAEAGISDFGEVFSAFRNRLGVYGYGDDQVRRIWTQVISL